MGNDFIIPAKDTTKEIFQSVLKKKILAIRMITKIIVPTMSALNLKKTSRTIPMKKGIRITRTSIAKLINNENSETHKRFI